MADASSEWMRLAVPFVLAQDLAPARDRVSLFVTDESSVYAVRASHTLRTTLEERNGTIEITTTLASIQTQRNERVQNGKTHLTGLIDSLDALARQLDSNAAPFGTRNSRALKSFVEGFFSRDLSTKIERLKDAIAIDGSFGLAYSVLLETLVAAGSSDVAGLVQHSDQKRASFTPVDRARYDFVRARLLHAPLTQQVAAGEALASALPNDAETLASVASVLFIGGRAQEGARLLNHALELNPDNTNLRRQLAIGLLENRQYAMAEKILQGMSNDAGALPALAVSVLFQGDAARAKTIYDRYLNSIGNADAKMLLRASWQAVTGDPLGGSAVLQNASFQDPRAAAYAKTQMVIWHLMSNDRRQAHTLTENAGIIAELFAQGASSAEEWRKRVEALPAAVANPETKKIFLANGYFLLGFYPQAAQAWEDLDRQAGGADLRARTMLAASLDKAGRANEARQIHVQPFIPDFNDLFSAVSFSQLRRLLSQAG